MVKRFLEDKAPVLGPDVVNLDLGWANGQCANHGLGHAACAFIRRLGHQPFSFDEIMGVLVEDSLEIVSCAMRQDATPIMLIALVAQQRHGLVLVEKGSESPSDTGRCFQELGRVPGEFGRDTFEGANRTHRRASQRDIDDKFQCSVAAVFIDALCGAQLVDVVSKPRLIARRGEGSATAATRTGSGLATASLSSFFSL